MKINSSSFNSNFNFQISNSNFQCLNLSQFAGQRTDREQTENIQRTYRKKQISALSIIKKNTIILCSPSRAYYRTDFDVFGLKMTVKEWSSAFTRKNWGFQNASLQKIQFSFRPSCLLRQENYDIFWCPWKVLKTNRCLAVICWFVYTDCWYLSNPSTTDSIKHFCYSKD